MEFAEWILRGKSEFVGLKAEGKIKLQKFTRAKRTKREFKPF